MAIKFLDHLDLNNISQLQDTLLHNTTPAGTTDVESKIIYDTANNRAKYYDGTNWRAMGVDVDEIAAGTSTGTPILVSTAAGTGNVSIQSMAYAGTTNVGHVPSGGSATTFLRGDGTWVTPTDTNTNQLTTFQVEDGDGTEVTISHAKEWKFVEGAGDGATIDINWTNTANGTDADPYDLTFNVTNTDKGSSQNIFKTVSVTDTDSGYTWAATGSAVADNNADTLTFVSGNGVDIDVDAASDAIRITAAGVSAETVQDIVGDQFVTNGTHSGISATYDDAGDGAIDLTNTDKGSSQFIFKNFAVATQSTIVADSNNDTLTFVAGDNITITTNATSDSITINSSDEFTGTVTGSGTQNTVPKWSSGGTGLQDSNITDDGSTVTVSSALTVTGNLTVSGSLTTTISEEVLVEDNIIVLNSNVTGTPTENSGIEVERGTATNVQLRWDETDDDWEFQAYDHAGTPVLQTYKIPTSYQTTIGNGVATSIAVTHNLGTKNVIVQLWDTSSFDTVFASVVRNTTNQVTIDFSSAPATGDITVLVIAAQGQQ